jgi:hypothetical protein
VKITARFHRSARCLINHQTNGAEQDHITVLTIIVKVILEHSGLLKTLLDIIE